MKRRFIHSLFYNIEQTARVCRAGADDYIKKHSQNKILLDDFIILETVLCFPAICQRDLAKLILKGTSHTSKLLAGLEEKGLIERPVDKKGNRIVRKIIITKEGLELFNNISKIANGYTNQIENIISKEEAAECENFLNKIKETITKSSNINFE